MLQPETYLSEERDQAEKMKYLRYEIQAQHEIEFREALIREKEEVQGRTIPYSEPNRSRVLNNEGDTFPAD